MNNILALLVTSICSSIGKFQGPVIPLHQDAEKTQGYVNKEFQIETKIYFAFIHRTWVTGLVALVKETIEYSEHPLQGR